VIAGEGDVVNSAAVITAIREDRAEIGFVEGLDELESLTSSA
jgi:hypothetical protein